MKTDAREFGLIQAKEFAADHFQIRLQVNRINVGLRIVQGEAFGSRTRAGPEHKCLSNRRDGEMATLMKPEVSEDRLFGIQSHRPFFAAIQEQGTRGEFLRHGNPALLTRGVVKSSHRYI